MTIENVSRERYWGDSPSIRTWITVNPVGFPYQPLPKKVLNLRSARIVESIFTNFLRPLSVFGNSVHICSYF